MTSDLQQSMGFEPRDYLEDQPWSKANVDRIHRLRREKVGELNSPRYEVYRRLLQEIPSFPSRHVVVDQSTVTIGTRTEFDDATMIRFRRTLEAFIPWKKGPFNLFGTPIDAEWRSDLKWERLLPHIAPLEGKRVADIGCHNGYFMFRMAAHKPAYVVGLEPVCKHWYAFHLMQRYARIPSLHFELLGVEHMDLFQSSFDTVFCLGILYHHTDPVGLLRKIREAMTPGGELIVDCQGIPGESPVALTPAKRYAKARGIWFLPTKTCLEHWIKRTGFCDVRCIFEGPVTSEEQRRTPWAPIASLSDFLDPSNPERTIEGHPAPRRIYIIAKNPG